MMAFSTKQVNGPKSRFRILEASSSSVSVFPDSRELANHLATCSILTRDRLYPLKALSRAVDSKGVELKERLLDTLACPEDGSDLVIEKPSFVDDEIKSGTLKCQRSHEYPIVGYIPRFVPSDLYVGNFSKEWLIHRTTQYDSFTGIANSQQAFSLKTGFSQDKLQDGLVLDAGCGSGRFLAVARSLGAEVVGLDLSHSVDAAMQLIGKDTKTHLIQGDILRPPFKLAAFDYVYSIGVLHHTRNAKEGFLKLCELLKQEGEIAVWVYPNDGVLVKAMNLVGDFYRRGASLMNLDTLYYV
jgi:uncharacterized protein YbaR (Trm112 family)